MQGQQLWRALFCLAMLGGCRIVSDDRIDDEEGEEESLEDEEEESSGDESEEDVSTDPLTMKNPFSGLKLGAVALITGVLLSMLGCGIACVYAHNRRQRIRNRRDSSEYVPLSVKHDLMTEEDFGLLKRDGMMRVREDDESMFEM